MVHFNGPVVRRASWRLRQGGPFHISQGDKAVTKGSVCGSAAERGYSSRGLRRRACHMETLEMVVSPATKEILPMSILIFQFSRNYY